MTHGHGSESSDEQPSSGKSGGKPGGSVSHTDYDESQTIGEATVDPESEQTVAHHTQLSATGRDTLRVIFALNHHSELDEQSTSGNIEHALKSEYGFEIGDIHHQLRKLHEKGFIQKRPISGSEFLYRITQRGVRVLTDLKILTDRHLESLNEQTE